MNCSMRYFVCSDHHFGQESFHKASKKFGTTMRPGYTNATDWAEAYVAIHNEVVPEHDSTVYFLGDIAKNITWAEKYFTQLNGTHKILIGGNHDSHYPTFRLQNLFDKIVGAVYVLDRKYLLTHIPVHPQELRGAINAHGHTHHNNVMIKIPHLSEELDDRYINVCVDKIKKPLEIV